MPSRGQANPPRRHSTHICWMNDASIKSTGVPRSSMELGQGACLSPTERENLEVGGQGGESLQNAKGQNWGSTVQLPNLLGENLV